MAEFSIEGRRVGQSLPAFLIAEVAQAHDGSLGTAHAFIDAAAQVGVDAIKFQTHIAAAESTRDEQFRIAFSRQDASRYDYWRRMEFTEEQWRGLCLHARQKGLVFLSSPFSVAAVELLQRLGVEAWKIGAGELWSADLMAAVLATGRPVLLSTGMSRYEEIADAVEAVRAAGAPLALLQCTSKYPTPLEEVGLNVMEELKERFGCPVGLSDHSGRPEPALAAVARGAAVVEVHVSFHRAMFGPDTPASLTFEELRRVVSLRDALAVMDAHPVNKDELAERLRDMRALFGKSLAPVRDLAAGTTLTRAMLCLKKPATGIPASRIDEVLGRRLRQAAPADRLLRWEQLE